MEDYIPSRKRIVSSFNAVLLALALPLLLAACGGGADSAIQANSASSSSASPDTTSPAISITAPTTGTSYTATSASITVTGSATDDVGLSELSWSNSLGGSGTLAVSGTSASGSFDVALASGANVITLTARNTRGKSAKKQLTIDYTPPDTTPPTVSITAPTTGTSYTATSASVSVSVTVTDNVGLSQLSWTNSLGGAGSQFISGTSATGSFSIALASGANVITLIVSDTSGNTAQKQLTVNYTPVPSADTTPPTVSITAPTTGTSYTATSASVTVSGTATDNVGLSQLSWTNSLGGAGSAAVSGTSASKSFSITLASGANVITLTASDTSGNTAQKQLTINYTPTSSNSAVLTWDAVSATNLSGYRLYYGTAPGSYLQSMGQGISVGNVTTYTLMGLSSGTRYYFAVTAFDASGNESGYSNEAFKDIP